MGKGKPASFKAWLGVAQTHHFSTKCETCRDYPELIPEIREFVAARRSGKIRVGLQRFYDTYLVPQGYTLSKRALDNHIYNCEHKLARR